MQRKLVFIINPISGKGSKKNIEALISAETTKKGLWFQFFSSVADGNYSFLYEFITTESITDIIIVGGDGTVSQVIQSLKQLPVQFGILPCGSGNGLAFGAGMPRNIKSALQIIYSNNSTLVDGYMINGHFACMLSGLGFDAKVAHDFANKTKRGLITYIKECIRNFILAKTYRFEINIDGNSFDIDAYFISIANSNQFGNNVKIAPKASLSDGLLDVVVVASSNKGLFAFNTFLQITGFNTLKDTRTLMSKKGILYFQTAAINIKNKSGALLHIDGEPVAAQENIEAKIIPQCFQLLTPANKN